MKTRPLAMILMTLFILRTATAAAPASTPAIQPLSNTRGATRELLLIHAEDLDRDQMFIACKAEAARLAHEKLGFNGNVSDFLQLSNNGGDQISFSVNLGDGVPAAAMEIADALVAWTQQYVKNTVEQTRKKLLADARDGVARTEKTSHDAETKYAQLRNDLRDLTGRTDVSADAVRNAITKLEEERQKLELDAMAKAARRSALESTIAEASKRVEDRIASDPIAAELQKVVDARQERVEIMKKQFAAATVSQAEVSEAVAAAAEARAKLLQRRHDAATEAGGATIDAFNRELMSISIDRNELDAKLSYLKKQLAGLREASDQQDALLRLGNEATESRQAFDQAAYRLRNMERGMANEGPASVMIKESVNTPAQ